MNDWRDFERRHGRRPRVLHVGNIANNAYLNAKFLREAGVDCHVMSYDYYDVMATPEWEGSARPFWFAQGPFSICNRYLHALLDGRRREQRVRWRQLAIARRLLQPIALETPGSSLNRVVVETYVTSRRARARALSYARRRLARGKKTAAPSGESAPDELDVLRGRLADDFVRVFPDRTDRLRPADVDHWTFRHEEWQRLFARYDVVQCYATDPIRALVAGTRPYVAFEHGTLRDFTLGDEPVHRMNALAYRLADHVLITNGDCLNFANALGIERFTPMIHPIDVEQHQRRSPDAATIRRDLGAKLILFSPLRHDWAIKGTDVHIRALPIIRERHPDVVLVLCEWGAELTRSRELIDELGCSHNVVWRPPLKRTDLIAHMQASDVVLDQMALPHFGATAPQALAAGRPVVMSYRPVSTAWIVEEPAPILAAFDPVGVAAAVDQALDPDWLRAFAGAASDWTDTYHHPHRIVRDHIRIYRTILGET